MTRCNGSEPLLRGAASDGVTAPPRLLSMCDESVDLFEFEAYLHSLPADSLWDIASHLDAERFPTRVDLAQREIERRKLDFVSPYSLLEQRMRTLFGVSVAFALLAAVLHGLGSIDIPLEPGEHLSWFFDLAVGGPAAARMMLPFVQFLAVGGALLTAGAVLFSLARIMRHCLRRDVLVMGVVASLLILAFGSLAGIV
jgi:hypothetical protein